MLSMFMLIVCPLGSAHPETWFLTDQMEHKTLICLSFSFCVCVYLNKKRPYGKKDEMRNSLITMHRTSLIFLVCPKIAVGF